MHVKNDYIRVSHLLDPWKQWKGISQDTLDFKAQIGTNVHEAINCHIIGLPVPELTDRERNYFESYLRWEDLEKPIYSLTEERFYNEDLMLTGQIDGIIDGMIIDFKTSSIALHKQWAIQLGWYYKLAEYNSIDVIPRAFMLQLKEKAPAKKHEYEITEELIGICESLYNIYVYFNPIKKEMT